MTLCRFDFETYSAAGFVLPPDGSVQSPPRGKKGIGGVGAYKYAKHESTVILLMAYDLDDGIGVRVWMPGCPLPTELFDHITSGGLMEAHNSMFEYWIWDFVCRRKMGWPELPLIQMRDSMPLAASFGVTLGLGNISKTGLIATKKLESGTKLINLFCVPQPPKKVKKPRKTKAPLVTRAT